MSDTTATSPDGTNFQVAVSFAGEQRPYVQRVAAALKRQGITVFYDADEEVTLWGKDLIEEFQRIYMNASAVVVMFISADYAAKSWTRHERRSTLARALEERREYVLPARFDETVLPGLNPNLAYLSLTDRSPEALAEQIVQKLVSLGVTVPARIEVPVTAARRARKHGNSDLTVTITSPDGSPISAAQVTAISSTGIATSGRTDELGMTSLRLPSRRLVSIYVAADRHQAGLVDDHDPADDLAIVLPELDSGGSIIFETGTGWMPGLGGSLNPIRDTSNRYYLYADNMSINDQPTQPYHFTPGQPLTMENSNGYRAIVTVLGIIGRTSLLQYDEEGLSPPPR